MGLNLKIAVLAFHLALAHGYAYTCSANLYGCQQCFTGGQCAVQKPGFPINFDISLTDVCYDAQTTVGNPAYCWCGGENGGQPGCTSPVYSECIDASRTGLANYFQYQYDNTGNRIRAKECSGCNGCGGSVYPPMPKVCTGCGQWTDWLSDNVCKEVAQFISERGTCSKPPPPTPAPPTPAPPTPVPPTPSPTPAQLPCPSYISDSAACTNYCSSFYQPGDDDGGNTGDLYTEDDDGNPAFPSRWFCACGSNYPSCNGYGPTPAPTPSSSSDTPTGAIAAAAGVAVVAAAGAFLFRRKRTTGAQQQQKTTIAMQNVQQSNPVAPPASGRCTSCGAQCAGIFCSGCGAKQ